MLIVDLPDIHRHIIGPLHQGHAKNPPKEGTAIKTEGYLLFGKSKNKALSYRPKNQPGPYQKDTPQTWPGPLEPKGEFIVPPVGLFLPFPSLWGVYPTPLWVRKGMYSMSD
jgi:hypothetical protein